MLLGDYMLKEKQLIEYLDPTYLYIPITYNNYKSNTYINKIDKITNALDIIYFPISGNIIKTTYKLNSKNKNELYLVIKNDFKEKTIYNKKYNLPNIDKKQNILIINAYDLEPFITYNNNLIKNYAQNLLETIDYIMEKNKINQTLIMTKDKDKIYFNNYLGTYPNIKLTSLTYKNSIPLNSIYNTYLYLKYQKPIITKIINIITPKHNLNIKVKLGTLLKDILIKFNLYQDIDNNFLLIINSCINGNNIKNDNLVITSDINSIIFIKNNFQKTTTCIKCGKCYEICPVNLIPIYIVKYIDNSKKLKKLIPNKCIECGLCSFVCPSKIELLEHIKIAKERIKNEL